MDQADVVDWCVSQLEECGKKAGMEAFKEAGSDGKITLILGGKVLVVDIELSVDRSDETRPKLSVIVLKTSYASPVSGATTEGSASMNGFLMDYIREFIAEAHKPLGEQDMKKAGKQVRGFLAHLEYLMKLDGMATQEGDGGLRWLNSIDTLALTAEGRAKTEAQSIAKYDQHAATLSLTDPSTGLFRSKGHLWTYICSSHRLFPSHTCHPPPSTSLCSSPRWHTSPSCANQLHSQPPLHPISQASMSRLKFSAQEYVPVPLPVASPL